MKLKRSLLACAVLAGLVGISGCQNDSDTAVDNNKETNVSRYVNPFIGTGNLGNTYPGATTPHGMVQLSPNNGANGWEYISGYYYHDNRLAGFSHTHLSGGGDWGQCPAINATCFMRNSVDKDLKRTDPHSGKPT